MIDERDIILYYYERQCSISYCWLKSDKVVYLFEKYTFYTFYTYYVYIFYYKLYVYTEFYHSVIDNNNYRLTYNNITININTNIFTRVRCEEENIVILFISTRYFFLIISY